MKWFIHILTSALPWRIQRFLRIVTDVQENLGNPLLDSRVVAATCVRPAVAESYGAFPIKTRWARVGGGFEPRYVYQLKDAEVVVENGLVSLDGHVIAESIGDHANATVAAVGWRLSRPFVRNERLDCDCEYALLRRDGYFHFVMEPLVELLYALQVNPNACVMVTEEDYRGYYRGYVELLQRRGVVKAVRKVRSSVLSVPRLIMAAAEQDAGMFCRETVDLLRKTFLAGLPPMTANRKIFLTRKGRRRFENQEELESIASSKGYEVIDTDGMGISEQIDLFRSATHIASNHGAGLTNLVYANPGTQVLELFSPKWLNDCYFRLSSICKLDYECLVAANGGQWGVLDADEFAGKLKSEDGRVS